jgi:pseudouridylate synthase
MTSDSELVRLNKHLATVLGVSRRQADELIEQGRVKVNDQPAIIGQKVTPDDHITVNHQPIQAQNRPQLIAVNKPTGVTCSRRHQKGDRTIYDLLPKQLHHLKTVGRLDKNSSGLILMASDGDFIHRMTHPSFQKTKVYKVRLDVDLAPLHQQMINNFGVTLADGRSQLNLSRLSDDHRRDWQVTMNEGRNRQIRRTFASLGYDVVKLHRIQFGPYQLTTLKPGEYTIIK